MFRSAHQDTRVERPGHNKGMAEIGAGNRKGTGSSRVTPQLERPPAGVGL